MSPKSQQDTPKLESRGSPAPGDARLASRKLLCAGRVHTGGEPKTGPELLVRRIAARVAEIRDPCGPVFDSLNRGDRVTIREGVFEIYRAIFDARLPGNERVRVLMRMLNDRYVPLEVGMEIAESEVRRDCWALSAVGSAEHGPVPTAIGTQHSTLVLSSGLYSPPILLRS